MKHFHILILITFSGLLLPGCSDSGKSKNKLDYSTIPVTEPTLEFSIEETEEYLPAQLERLMVSDDGSILVSQRAEKSLHQFDSLGNYLTRVAGPGRGPGELTQYANPHFNGEMLVMSNNNGLLTEYRPDEKGIFEYVRDHNFRMPGTMRGIRSGDSFNSFFVSVDSVDIPFGIIPPEYTTDLIHYVKITEDSLQVEEQVFSLRKHSSYVRVTDDGRGMTYSTLPYRCSDHLKTLPENRVLVQRPGSSSIEIYDSTLTLEHTLYLDVKERPVTDEDIDRFFKQLSQSEINDRMDLIEDLKPPFLGVFLDDEDRFILRTDETSAGDEYVVLSYTGEPLARFYLPLENDLHAIRNGKLYTIRDPWGNAAVEVYSIEL